MRKKKCNFRFSSWVYSPPACYIHSVKFHFLAFHLETLKWQKTLYYYYTIVFSVIWNWKTTIRHLQHFSQYNIIWKWYLCKVNYLCTIFALYRSGRLGAFTAKSGRTHYNPPPLTVMWMNFDSPNFPSLCSLSAIISFQTCSNKCILYVLSFHKCIKIKYKTVNKYGVFRD